MNKRQLLKTLSRWSSVILCAGTVVCARAASPGSALLFDGTNGYVQVPNNAALNAYPITVTVWFRMTGAGSGVQGLVSKYADVSANGWALIVQGGLLRAFYYVAGNFNEFAIDATTGAVINDGFWHQAALVVDASGGKLYLDGVLQAATAWAGAAAAPTSTELLQIGRYYNFPARFQGDIDEVAVWNRALGSAELNYLSHRMMDGTEDGLLGLWHFDEGAGSTVADATGHGYTGSFATGSPQWVTSTAPLVFNQIAGKGLKFSGGLDYVTVPDSPALDPYPMTAMAWVRTTRVSAIVDGIVSKYVESSLNGYSLFVYNGHVRAWYFRDSTDYIWDGSLGIDGGMIADGQWHHVALVVDAAGGRIYVDGVQGGSSMAWHNSPGPPTTTYPFQIGKYWTYNNSLLGMADEVSVWNTALTPAQIRVYKNAALTGSETGLVALWRLSEGAGTTTIDLTGNGHTGTLVNGPVWAGSTAFLGDGTSVIHTELGTLQWTRQFALATSATQQGFAANGRFWARRLDDFGAPGGSTAVALTLQDSLQSTLLAGPVPLVNTTTQFNLSLGPFNAAVPQGSAGGVQQIVALNLQPQIQLDSVNDTFALGLAETHTVNGGPTLTGETSGLAPVPLLDFDGNLYFGSIQTTFASLTNTPTRGALSGGGVSTILAVNNNSGTLVGNPAYHYGNGALLNAVLMSNGDAIAGPGVTVSLVGSDSDCIQNICYQRSGLTLSNNAFRGIITLQLPPGFSVCTNFSNTNRLTVGQLAFGTQLLDINMRPVVTSLVRSGTIFGVEETKPFWIQAAGLNWQISAGQILLQSPSGIRFVRQEEDDALSAAVGTLVDPTMANRVSNDGYYRNAGLGSSQAIVTADANGLAQLTVTLALDPPELRPHFPYAGRAAGGQIPTAPGGQFIINAGLIDTVNSSLPVSGPVPALYSRDCFDTNCSATSIVPETLAFTPTGNQLSFTPDGGLLAYGAIPPENLTWGYAGAGNFAQRTSDVSTGAWEMAGTFLRSGQSALDVSRWPAVILFSGFGDAADPTYFERPGQANYTDGFANYPGVNFRAPAQGRSWIADILTDWYPLTARSKYYARFGGVSGIHESAIFPANLSLYGYAFTFTEYRLSYLDSQNWDSRTDGSVILPFPSQFQQEFERMKFVCSGGLDSARVHPSTPPKEMVYWNTLIQPQSIEFHPTNNDVCATSKRFLVMGVETKLPFIPQAFHAVLGFKNNGNLVTSADNVAGADSRFPVPANLTLQGSGGSSFPLSTAGDGYFNSWETANSPGEGFFNIAGKVRVPFFSDVKVHLHVTPTGSGTPKLAVMGGWKAADGEGKDLGWSVGGSNYFNTAKFDRHHDGWPQGISIDSYRGSNTEDFHPRAQRNWIDVAKFDYPLDWNPLLQDFKGFSDAKVILPVIDVNSRLKELSPGKVDFDFAQDITVQLPRLKVLDFANDAFNEFNGPIITVSNAIRQELGPALGTTGLTSGFRSLQRALREDASGFFRPVLQPALDPVAARLYSLLAEMQRTNSANLLSSTMGIVSDVNNGLRTAIQGINGDVSQANTVFGQLDQVLNDVDDTIGLMLHVFEKDGQGNRHVIRAIVQKLAHDQGPIVGFAVDLGDDVVNGLLQDLEPTLAKIEAELNDLRSQFGALHAQIAGATGSISGALAAAVNDANGLSRFVQSSGMAVSNLLQTVIVNRPDYFTADPAGARAAIRDRLILAFLGSPLTGNYQQTFKQFMFDDNFVLDQLMDVLFDQVNRSIRDGLSSNIQGANDGIFQALKGAGALSQSLLSAKIRGAPTFEGDSLRRIHLDANVQMNLPDEMHFTAYMDIKELTSESTPLDCIPAGAPAAEVTLGARDVPLSWAGISPSSGTPLTLSVEGRWTLQSGSVLGVGGLFDIKGEAGFKGCSLKELGATFTFGELENYFAAKAAGNIIILGIPVDMQAGLFAGHACSLDPLKFIDPDAPEVLENATSFRGLYVQYGGGLSLSEILLGTSSCFLDVQAGISTAIFYQDGPRSGRIGFRQKESLDLELLCLISGSADLALGASATISPPELDIIGTATLCGKLGYCPFCVQGCKSLTVKGVVKQGGIDYFLDF